MDVAALLLLAAHTAQNRRQLTMKIEGVLEDDITGSEGLVAPNNAPRSPASLAVNFNRLVRVRMKFVSNNSHWV